MKLIQIQNQLKAPKNQKNSFGGYNYRSCEDILEALKPLLLEHKCALTVSDDIVAVGDRVYVKATARLESCEDGKSWETTAFAREAFSKKGMDEAQITGSASSYARKYALNGLFAIDDTKDADTQDNTQHETQKPPSAKEKVAQALADDSKKWFEIQWPFDAPEKYKGSELSTVAAAGDVQSFRKIETYLGDVLLEKYPQAHKNLDAAIAEASNNQSKEEGNTSNE